MGNQAKERARRRLRVALRVAGQTIGHVSIDATKLAAAVTQRAEGDSALARHAMLHLRLRAEEAADDALEATIDDAVTMAALKPLPPWLRDRAIAALALRALKDEAAIAATHDAEHDLENGVGNDAFNYPAAAYSQRWRSLQIRYVQRGLGHILTRGSKEDRAAFRALFRLPSHRPSPVHGGRAYVEQYAPWFLDGLRSVFDVPPSKRWASLSANHPEVTAAWLATERTPEDLSALRSDELSADLGAELAAVSAGYKPK